MKNAAFTIVTEPRASKGSQSLDMRWEVRHRATGTVLRIRVKRDSYDEQSHVVAETLEMPAAKWNPFHSIPIAGTPVQPDSYVSRLDAGVEYRLRRTGELLLPVIDEILSATLRQGA